MNFWICSALITDGELSDFLSLNLKQSICSLSTVLIDFWITNCLLSRARDTKLWLSLLLSSMKYTDNSRCISFGQRIIMIALEL